MPEYATPDQLFANLSPEPLSFDYTVSDSGLTVRVEGLSKPPKRKGIYTDIAHHSDGLEKGALIVVHPTTGERYTPERSDVVSAAWCAACVATPKMTLVQWLQYGAENSLDGLYERCLVASRLIGDDEAGIKSGEAAAEAEFDQDFTPSAGTSTV